MLGTALLFGQCQPTIETPQATTAQARVGANLLTLYPNGIPALAKGINLSSWFGQGANPAQYGTRFGTSAFTQIKSLGFTHVRIPISPTNLFDEANPGVLKASVLTSLVTGVDRAIAAGLAVVLDPIHANGDSDFENKLANDPAFLPKAQAYWTAIATQFASRPTDKVFFEIMNEPHMAGPAGWYQSVQASLISSVQAVAPNHIILATAYDWSSLDALLAVTPTDKSVVWNFHYYSPMVFTHQGASWVTPPFLQIKNVPYPSTPTNVLTAYNAATDPTAKNYIQYYGSERWGAAKVAADLGRIVTWARNNGVLITCNEFGVYKTFAPATSRKAWITDVRKTFDTNKIGWSMWEYDEGFGLVTYKDPANRTGVVVDRNIRTALGL